MKRIFTLILSLISFNVFAQIPKKVIVKFPQPNLSNYVTRPELLDSIKTDYAKPPGYWDHDTLKFYTITDTTLADNSDTTVPSTKAVNSKFSSKIDKTDLANIKSFSLSDTLTLNGVANITPSKNIGYNIVSVKDTSLFRWVTKVWNGSSFTQGFAIGIGHGALQNNTGYFTDAFGYSALQNNTGNYSNGFGTSALYNNTGSYVNAFGAGALQYNIAFGASGFGNNSLQNNTGSNSAAFGYNSGSNNKGTYSNGFGSASLFNNSGPTSNAFGASSLQNNSGINADGFGHTTLMNNSGSNAGGFGATALYGNSGNYSYGFGNNSLQQNAGDYSHGFGFAALRYNNWDNTIAIGYNNNLFFTDDTTTKKNFTSSNINIAAKTITITGHGFGATGRNINLRFTLKSGTAPSGLTSTNIYEFTIKDANTLQWNAVINNITDTGSNAVMTFNNSINTSNTIAIGNNVSNTKSNQAIIGDTTINETWLRGPIIKTLPTDSVGDFLVRTTASGWVSRRTPTEVLSDIGGAKKIIRQTYTGAGTVLITDSTGFLVIDPPSLSATTTITTPANPYDGQKIDIVFGGTITSGMVITSLTLAANTGQSILGTSTYSNVQIEDRITLQYNSSNSKWYH